MAHTQVGYYPLAQSVWLGFEGPQWLFSNQCYGVLVGIVHMLGRHRRPHCLRILCNIAMVVLVFRSPRHLPTPNNGDVHWGLGFLCPNQLYGDTCR